MKFLVTDKPRLRRLQAPKWWSEEIEKAILQTEESGKVVEIPEEEAEQITVAKYSFGNSIRLYFRKYHKKRVCVKKLGAAYRIWIASEAEQELMDARAKWHVPDERRESNA
jgi:hypothetical protein